MYLMTEEEELAALSMCQGYLRLKELGWKNIAEFEPPAQGFVPPFLGIEVGACDQSNASTTRTGTSSRLWTTRTRLSDVRALRT